VEYQWHRFVEAHRPEHSGVILDALQRYLQFDTYAGIIPPEAIDLIVSKTRLQRLAEQAFRFQEKYRDTLMAMPQKMREAALRAHFSGIINTPVPSSDLWHDSFHQLHESNRRFYDGLSTAGRVEELLKDLECADIIAASVSKYQNDHVTEYTPGELVAWSLEALRFYETHRQHLERYGAKEQRAIITQHLEGRSDIAW
jgi:hypothetical protein